MSLKYLYLAIFFTFTLSGCWDDESDEDRTNRMKSLLHTVSKDFNSQWKEVFRNSDKVSYLHPDMIFQDEKKNWIREAEVLIDYVSNKRDGFISKDFRSSTAEVVFDCQSWKLKFKAVFNNKSPMNRSQLKTDIARAPLSNKDKDWIYPASTSLGDSWMKYVCNYDKPKKREVFLNNRWEVIMKLRKLRGDD